jgi:DNA-binding MarR family transcriptional regulator
MTAMADADDTASDATEPVEEDLDPAETVDPDAADHAVEQAVVALRAVLIAGDRYRAAVAEHFGIGAVESVVLSLLSEAGQPLTPHQIGSRMLLSSGTVTAILDRLERAGHIRRTQHPTDRRSRLIVLTPAGRRVLQFSNNHLRAVLASATDGPIGSEVLHALRRIGHLLDERTEIVAGA